MFISGPAQRRGVRSTRVGISQQNAQSSVSGLPAGDNLNQVERATTTRKYSSIGDPESSGLIIQGTHYSHVNEGQSPPRHPDFPISFSGHGIPKFTTPIRLGAIDSNLNVNGNTNINGSLTVDTNTTLKGDADITGTLTVGTLEGLDQSTCIKTGGLLSNANTPTAFDFNITPGTGVIVNAGVETQVTWNTLNCHVPETTIDVQPGDGIGSGQTIASGRILTFICIGNTGTPVYSTERPTAIKQREYLFVGVVVHIGSPATSITVFNDQQIACPNPFNQLVDLATAIGFINVSGNECSGIAPLKILKTEGTMFAMGSNYKNSSKNPNLLTLPEINTNISGIFQYRVQDGTSSVLTLTDINPNIYDDGTPYDGVAPTVTTNKWTIQRIYSFTSNALKIQLGQAEYNNQDDAIAGIQTEAFITEPSIIANGLLIGYLVIKQGCSDITDTAQAVFKNALKFGGGGGSATSGLDISGKLNIDGTSTMTGNLNLGGNEIMNCNGIQSGGTLGIGSVSTTALNLGNAMTTNSITLGKDLTTGTVTIGNATGSGNFVYTTYSGEFRIGQNTNGAGNKVFRMYSNNVDEYYTMQTRAANDNMEMSVKGLPNLDIFHEDAGGIMNIGAVTTSSSITGGITTGSITVGGYLTSGTVTIGKSTGTGALKMQGDNASITVTGNATATSSTIVLSAGNYTTGSETIEMKGATANYKIGGSGGSTNLGTLYWERYGNIVHINGEVTWDFRPASGPNVITLTGFPTGMKTANNHPQQIELIDQDTNSIVFGGSDWNPKVRVAKDTTVFELIATKFVNGFGITQVNDSIMGTSGRFSFGGVLRIVTV